MSDTEEDTITLRDSRDIKMKIKIERCSRGSSIIALAIDTLDFDKNTPKTIPCRRGDYINNTVYDLTRDCYYVECVDYCQVGEISVSYKLKMEGILCWEVFTPLPEVVIKRHLNEDAKKKLDDWKSQYRKEKYSIRYLQLTRVY